MKVCTSFRVITTFHWSDRVQKCLMKKKVFLSFLLELIKIRSSNTRGRNILPKCFRIFVTHQSLMKIVDPLLYVHLFVVEPGTIEQGAGNEPSITTVLSYMNKLCSLRVGFCLKNSKLVL